MHLGRLGVFRTSTPAAGVTFVALGVLEVEWVVGRSRGRDSFSVKLDSPCEYVGSDIC